MTQVLKIEFNEWSNNYELWRLFLNKKDSLYPLEYKLNEYTSPTKEMCISYAKRHFSQFLKNSFL